MTLYMALYGPGDPVWPWRPCMALEALEYSTGYPGGPGVLYRVPWRPWVRVGMVVKSG